MKDPNAPNVPIIQHPDVRRMLMWMKSVTEGMRAMLYYALLRGPVRYGENAEERKVSGFPDILIPSARPGVDRVSE